MALRRGDSAAAPGGLSRGRQSRHRDPGPRGRGSAGATPWDPRALGPRAEGCGRPGRASGNLADGLSKNVIGVAIFRSDPFIRCCDPLGGRVFRYRSRGACESAGRGAAIAPAAAVGCYVARRALGGLRARFGEPAGVRAGRAAENLDCGGRGRTGSRRKVIKARKRYSPAAAVTPTPPLCLALPFVLPLSVLPFPSPSAPRSDGKGGGSRTRPAPPARLRPQPL